VNAAYEAGASGPLKGIRVLDWTMWQFGPMSSAMMGDMGADVLKIEALDGDSGRGLARASTLRTGLPEGRNVYFETNNRNKRGLAVNLKTKEGQEIVHKLVKNADVFVQNFRKGVAERLNVATKHSARSTPCSSTGPRPDTVPRDRMHTCRRSTAAARPGRD